MKKYILQSLVGVFVLVVCGGCDEKEVAIQVENELIKPYFQLVIQEKYKEAYTTFTSDFYKKHSSFEVYLNSYKKNKVKRGKLTKYSVNAIRLYSNLFGKDEVRGEIAFHFQNEKYTKPILFIIKQDEKGKYLIDAAWHHNKFSVPDGLDGPF